MAQASAAFISSIPNWHNRGCGSLHLYDPLHHFDSDLVPVLHPFSSVARMAQTFNNLQYIIRGRFAQKLSSEPTLSQFDPSRWTDRLAL